MKPTKVTLDIRKTKDGKNYSQIRFSLKKKVQEFLQLELEEKIYFVFSFNNSYFSIQKEKMEDENFVCEKRTVKKKGKNGMYILFPSSFYPVLKKLNLWSNFLVKEHFIEKDRRVDFYMPTNENDKKNVILFKVNKGGVGKTFLSAQIGHGLSLTEKKVLIITSDSQNNILNFLYQGDKKFEKGLQNSVLRNQNFYIELRKNLHFIPLESNRMGKIFIEKLEGWLLERKKEYDYILIDSVPTMKIDSEFVRLSDYIIIPTFCDEATTEGVLNLLDEIPIEKVFAIQVNRFKKRRVEMKYLKFLKNQLKNTPIYLGEPIKDLSFVASMLDRKKSVWEYENKQAVEVQDILLPLLDKIINLVEKNERGGV